MHITLAWHWLSLDGEEFEALLHTGLCPTPTILLLLSVCTIGGVAYRQEEKAGETLKHHNIPVACVLQIGTIRLAGRSTSSFTRGAAHTSYDYPTPTTNTTPTHHCCQLAVDPFNQSPPGRSSLVVSD